MEILKTVSEMQAWSDNIHQKGNQICLVPTMGYFHEGHLSLMEKGKEFCPNIVVSLFVNPTQFGENEDLDSYPANIERDVKLAEEKGVSVVFMPDKKEIYPGRFQTYVELTELPAHLCGLSRPVHFRGVATVVTKLFNIVKPDVAIFGSKDFQQLQIIRRMVKDLNYNIKIVGCPIVREDDGLAMSSRNAYLSPEQRQSALCLSKALEKAEAMIAKGEIGTDTIKKELENYIKSFPFTKIDYISICDPETLDETGNKIQETRYKREEAGDKKQILIALAVYVGKTRLIDNRIINPEQ